MLVTTLQIKNLSYRSEYWKRGGGYDRRRNRTAHGEREKVQETNRWEIPANGEISSGTRRSIFARWEIDSSSLGNDLSLEWFRVRYYKYFLLLSYKRANLQLILTKIIYKLPIYFTFIPKNYTHYQASASALSGNALKRTFKTKNRLQIKVV